MFLIFDDFKARCSYKLVLIKKVYVIDDSRMRRTLFGKKCTGIFYVEFERGLHNFRIIFKKVIIIETVTLKFQKFFARFL